MQYRTLGRTGLDVSILGFGASSLGGVFREVDEQEAIRAVHAALDFGINYLDVAPYYGDTRAETVLGKAIADIARHRYLVATKVGRYGSDAFDFSRARTLASIDESLARLGCDWIDVIQCHDIEFGDLNQLVDETIPALRDAQDAGKVRFIGITGLPLAIFRAVLARAQVDTILSYCHLSLNDTALLDEVEFLRRHRVGIISASPLSMGLLSSRGAPDWHPAPAEVKARCAAAAAHCERKGVPLAKLAVQFSVSHCEVHTTIVGTADPKHIADNIAWLNEPLDEDLLAEVRAILAPIQNVTWPSGRPENDPSR